MNIDYYKELCERADYYGMDSLTEEEQIYLINYNKESGECNYEI